MNKISITINNNIKREYTKGISFKDIVNDVITDSYNNFVYAKFNGKRISLIDKPEVDGNINIYTLDDIEGNRTYERGLIYLFEVCAFKILGRKTNIKVKYSLDHGVYCEINKAITEEQLNRIKEDMKERISLSIPFEKTDMTKEEAIDYFESIDREDKKRVLFYNPNNIVTLYKFGDILNYIAGDLPENTSVLKYFDLTLIKNKGIVVRYPSIYDKCQIIKYTHHDHYFNSLEEYTKWGINLDITNLGELNDYIVKNNGRDLIELSEIIQNYKLLNIAEEIVLNRDTYKIILLSGPSSSGKTTTSKKLSLYLKTLGLNPTHLSLDDYFLEREETPLGANGKPDFESLNAIDVKLFDSQISKLLKGNSVITPTFDFIDGKKEFNREIKLEDNDILIIEGLHALNDEILTNIPKKNKFKIYLSPLSYLSIDNDNRISMTDLRLLRRMIRDNRTRGYNPSKTLSNWSDVRLGEEKYVFPFQDSADIIFNTSLVYELSVLKPYAESLLFSIKEEDPEYETARRLLNLLKNVLPLSSENVPKLSILREFIGGSYFE